MMSTTMIQPALFEVDADGAVLEATYDDDARLADLTLCQHYFRAWCTSVGNLDGSPAGHPCITRDEFEAAAARLATPLAERHQ